MRRYGNDECNEVDLRRLETAMPTPHAVAISLSDEQRQSLQSHWSLLIVWLTCIRLRPIPLYLKYAGGSLEPARKRDSVAKCLL